MTRRRRSFSLGLLLTGLAGAALVPAVDRALARRIIDDDVRAVQSLAAASGSRSTYQRVASPELAWPRTQRAGVLASWANVGGCGAGGGAASSPGGGIKWVGRNVTGGLLDAQVMATQSYSRGSEYATVSTRLGTILSPRWRLALNVPVLYKEGNVTVLGATKRAGLAGFGDLSLEIATKLGTIGSHQLSLTAVAPTGAADAVRQGIVLPQHLQLGAGVPGAVAQYEHTRDQDWGLFIVGGSVGYGGWENRVGDFRAASASAYVHAGYLAGPWVPSAGLTVFGKATHDRERGAARAANRDPLFMVMPSLGIEWSTDSLAVLPGAVLGLSPTGFQSILFGVGISSSLF